jgi:hypothetical protein
MKKASRPVRRAMKYWRFSKCGWRGRSTDVGRASPLGCYDF